MREIKFKAWQKYHKEMLDIVLMQFDEVGIKSVVVSDSKGRQYSYCKDDNKFNLETLVLMQNTGLKDKNGIELYEEDICEYHNGRGVYVGVVKYIQEYSAFRLVFNDGTWTDLAFVEVIGNIFENPELLEQK